MQVNHQLTHDGTRGFPVRPTCRLSLILACVTPFGLAQTPPADSLRPFLSGNCYACHNSQAKTAGLDLETYASRMSILEDRATWESVLQMLKSGQMPPEEHAASQ